MTASTWYVIRGPVAVGPLPSYAAATRLAADDGVITDHRPADKTLHAPGDDVPDADTQGERMERTIDAETGEILPVEPQNGLALLSQATRAIQAGEPMTDLALTLVSAAQRALAQSHTVMETKSILDKMTVVELYLKQHAQLTDSNLAVAQRLRTERQLGRQIPDEFPVGRPVKQLSPGVIIKLKDTGITPNQSAAFQKEIEYCPDDDDFEGWVHENLETKELTRELFLREFRFMTPYTEPELPTGKYRVLYADPPWEYGNTMPDYFYEQADHYPLMTVEEIAALPVGGMAEDDAVLFLWVTSPILAESFAVINAWGFQYKASFVWDKVKHNMGHYNSVRHEFLLVCVKGSCQPDVQKLFDSVITEERTEHSRKPDVFRTIIDTLYPAGARIELFARERHDGWEVYGNQLS